MKIINLSKMYNGKYIFQDLNYEFKKGNIYWLKGPNGAGKSSLLRCIANLEKPTTGRVVNPNKHILYLPEVELTEDWLTIRENIELLYRISGITLDNRDSIYTKLNIKGELDTLSINCSRGTNMKVGCSLLFKMNFWDLILIDEALAHIDINTQEAIFRELVIRASERSTIIFTKHDDITERFNRDIVTIYLNGGRIYEI